jgi:hypothetical protein
MRETSNWQCRHCERSNDSASANCVACGAAADHERFDVATFVAENRKQSARKAMFRLFFPEGVIAVTLTLAAPIAAIQHLVRGNYAEGIGLMGVRLFWVRLCS